MDRRLAALALAALAVLAGCTGGVPVPESGDGGAAAGSGPTATPTVAGEGEGVRVTVVRVVDGDTMEIRFDDGTADTVRLLGVDTPEVHSENTPGEYEGIPETEAGKRCLGRYGERASAFAKDRLAGETVRLRFDPESDRRGYYGRLLGYLVVDGENVNRLLLEEGLARVYDSRFTERERFYEAESTAREAGAGLWACATDTDSGGTATATPATGRSDGRLRVVEIAADAPGNDNENLDGEHVVLENAAEESLDLSGWTVTDEAGHTYTFGDVTLDPGERVTLYTGSGSDNATSVYWGRSSAVWNNGGDTVTVRDAGGDVVAERSY
ncbi:endonuclease [Halobacteriales archaeon QS_5_70_15]|nr:MAG: endonuclease [Halobacteriales archaeon QS_5_70_15]